MEQQERNKTIHYYDRELRQILCGVDDPTAHWTIRSRVNCPDCSTLLRERRRPAAAPAKPLADAAASDAL
ncbi:hypothetical protein [Anaeromyxobacter sp. Fw109-5]|uniref:hypothetical protein n=1 Tax=Anaeromyxobacter sp. (strain Fw109-5) TaxID=404589 RepID=UPI0003082384|nr:hypothetical protein [Anaeromyxobacter sp. Fw109-5]